MPYFKDLRDQEMAQFTAGPQGFGRSISRSNLADNNSQYSRRNSDNASDQGSSVAHPPGTNLNNSVQGGVPAVGPDGKLQKGKINLGSDNNSQANGSFYNKSLQR